MAAATAASASSVLSSVLIRDWATVFLPERQGFPEKSRIYFDESLKAFQSNGVLVSGLCSGLQQLYYPNYSYSGSVQQNSISLASSSKTKKRVSIWVARRMRKNALLPPDAPGIGPVDPCIESALAAGIKLDNEITETVALFVRYPDIPMSVFYETSDADFYTIVYPYVKEASLVHAIANTLRKIGAPTREVWRELHNLQLRPVASQVVCWVPAWRRATKADLVCVTQSGVLLVIENKLGYDNAEYNSGHVMSEPFDDYKDCPLNQWQLQLLCTTRMMEVTFPHLPFRHGMIFQITRQGGGKFAVCSRVQDVGFLVMAPSVFARLAVDAVDAVTLVKPASKNVKRAASSSSVSSKKKKKTKTVVSKKKKVASKSKTKSKSKTISKKRKSTSQKNSSSRKKAEIK